MEKVIDDLISVSNIDDSHLDFVCRDCVIDLVNEIKKVLFIGYFEKNIGPIRNYLISKFNKIKLDFSNILLNIYSEQAKIDFIVDSFMKKIPLIKEKLNKDLQAFMKNDPAVTSEEEVILSYPGYYAIVYYRVAHEMILLNIPKLPRIVSEHAHSKTGIDIHPGAIINDSLFLDHGTGIVIGETTEIGRNVKIYQGVTLGAISLDDAIGLRGTKRHPTVLDNVTIYSGAVILGGNTVIGSNSIIGSNVFITKSVENDVKILLKSPDVIKKNND